MAVPKIFLTPPEKLFRQCLLDCRADSTEPGMSDLVLRFTGGWVRDKLLGVQSHDIDVALSTMTGEQFGLALQSYMLQHASRYEAEADKQGFKAELKNLHKIDRNPEKSKHLETIHTNIFGIDVDFVNLRKEVYDDSSRNPIMEFGTAEQDATRRDATVNALFYNLDTQDVEDLTRRGLDDMKAKILRTPLQPYQTFMDDPLRVLRLIRFACRLGYNIDPSAREAMKNATIHDALTFKITRERVGIEVGKIFTGPDPFTGLTDIVQLNLYSTVFADPSDSRACPASSSAQLAYDGLRRVLEQKPSICLSLKPKEDQAMAWFLASYVPWSDLGHKAYNASRNAIKATNIMSKVLDDAIKARHRIMSSVELVNDGKATRGEIGMVLRASKGAWRHHTLYSLLCDIVSEGLDKATDRYTLFLAYIQDHALEDAASVDKALVLKGNEIKQALCIKEAGPWIKQAVDMVAKWQLDQESTPTKAAASAMILERKKELGLE
ncbi:hypothetical protein DV736_g6319, partial [Chaetothyriales sp. CBS 134916]